MRRSTVLNLRRFKLLETVGKNRLLLSLCLMFFIGVIIGTVSRGSNERLEGLSESLLRQFLADRQGLSFGAVLLGSVSASLLYMLAVYIAGASMLGIVLIPLIVAWRGFCYGLLIALLYSEYALRGVAFNAIVLIPPAVIFLIGLLLAARESMSFSLVIARLTLPRSNPANLFADFRIFCSRYALLLIFTVLSAVADALVSHFFLRFFDFQF